MYRYYDSFSDGLFCWVVFEFGLGVGGWGVKVRSIRESGYFGFGGV